MHLPVVHNSAAFHVSHYLELHLCRRASELKLCASQVLQRSACSWHWSETMCKPEHLAAPVHAASIMRCLVLHRSDVFPRHAGL